MLFAEEDTAKKCFALVFAYDPSFRKSVQVLVKCYLDDGEKEKAGDVIAGYLKTAHGRTGFVDELYDLYPDLKTEKQ